MVNARNHLRWCERQTEKAQDTLDYIGSGGLTSSMAKKKMRSIAAKAAATIASIAALIGAYAMLLN